MEAMPTTARRPFEEAFEIHEDARTEETEVMVDEDQPHRATQETVDELDQEDEGGGYQEDERDGEAEAEEEEDEEDDDDVDEEQIEQDSSDDEHVESSVQADIDRLQDDFPRLRDKYRLIKRIGEGTFSTVFKAEDLQYDRCESNWDPEDYSAKWTPPPLKGRRQAAHGRPRRTRYVAIKKIYVTSSPVRILNELELLHDLRRSPSVCPLISAFRHTDQVVAILPYFRHGDFRAYFRDMTIPDMTIYLRSLFTALKSVHEHRILHRDIKPTNFLYDPQTRHGVLVDFGLAEREGTDCKPCLCHESRETRKHRVSDSVWSKTSSTTSNAQPGYPKSDTRPSRRANRAGTRGFRAPEVLFKCTEQTTAIDIWSTGVILLTILSKRFPFFNSADDVEAMIEIATIFGFKRMKSAGLLHGCVFETTIPTISQQGFSMEKIIHWSTCRPKDEPLTPDEKLAVRFLERCMELDPSRRITAVDALEHEFLSLGKPQEAADDDEMDMLRA